MRLSIVLLFCAICLPAQVSAGPSANDVLEATQVRGGLVVHIGCGDGEMAAALRVNDRFVVHGLDTDTHSVAAARDYVQSRGLYGRVSIDAFDGERCYTSVSPIIHNGHVRLRAIVVERSHGQVI